MGTQPTGHDPRAWRADTLDAPVLWYHPLSEPCLAEFDGVLSVLEDRPIPEQPALAALGTRWADRLAPARQTLEAGRGFVIFHGVPPGRYSPRALQALYWTVGNALGRPLAQNVAGTLLYDVCDTGQEVAQGARFSVTSYESSFHTDNSFGEEVADHVGLLCLNRARAGGRSQLVSGHAVVEVLERDHPEMLDVLRQPFHVERRGGVRPGEPATVLRPVLTGEGDGVLFRYLRYWIEAGHTRAGEPLTARQTRALDVLDQVLRRPELRAELDLAPGEMFFINNRWLLHNRTAFEDHPEPERRRHLVRLWCRRVTP